MLATLAAMLWIGFAQTQGGYHDTLLIGAWIASGLLLVSGVWLIFRAVKKRDEEELPNSHTSIYSEGGERLDVRGNYFGPGTNPLRTKDTKGVSFEDNIVSGTPRESASPRKSWSFPEMPWKKKKPDSDSG